MHLHFELESMDTTSTLTMLTMFRRERLSMKNRGIPLGPEPDLYYF